ncbi:Zn-dependent exopeptidase [Cylindrobasidium torrendii FP15055 ss-10]|uniref:Inactive metallocarboxypeptidase ECM14 n=1 Tax=Cylindrobasidium torrendii FP15055 ss-10 TaxID=1314674 RepID=A0A0D7BN31_9AGAR|nr:Zn-dependent exopeptidase [Cylindrobasidium torrendii FP15055 ss-10]
MLGLRLAALALSSALCASQDIPQQPLFGPVPTHTPSEAFEWDLTYLNSSDFHSAYHPLHEIQHFLTRLTETFPNAAQEITIGRSSEGREIRGIVLTGRWKAARRFWDPEAEDEWEDEDDEEQEDVETKNEPEDPEDIVEEYVYREADLVEDDDDDENDEDDNEPEVRYTSPPPPPYPFEMVVIGAQHARDWVATSTALYIAHALAIEFNATNSKASAKESDWSVHIVPAPNPDGYVYTWETDRFWYKTRHRWGSPAGGKGGKKIEGDESGECIGIDMNRNYGYKWKKGGCFDGSGEHWYPGTRPFEAPETNAIANYAANVPWLGRRVFLDLRSYGQMISSPFSYSCKRVPRDAEDQLEAALGASRALTQVHRTQFSVGSLCESFYRAPGNVVDWMYKRAGFKYTYAIHLPDTGTFGYVLPADRILPVGEETLGMVEYFLKWVQT